MQGTGPNESLNAKPSELLSHSNAAFSPSLGSQREPSGRSTGLQQMKSNPEDADKDDVSEDDDDEDRPPACGSKLGNVLRAAVPDYYPFFWMLLPLAVCAVLFLLNFGKVAPGETYIVAVEDSAKADVDYELLASSPLQAGSIRVIQLQNEGYLTLLYWSLCSTALWFVFMLFRLLLMLVVMNLLADESQVLTAFLTPVDPELVYVVWSAAVYGIWRTVVVKSEQFIIPYKGSSSRTFLYHTRLFGGLSIKQDLMEQCNQLWIAIIVLTVRRLLLSLITFLFEIGFMKSMNTQLVIYLSKYSILRRLNTKWIASMDVKNDTVPRNVTESDIKKTNSLSTANDLSMDRSSKLAVFRFRNILSKARHNREYFGSGMPEQLKKSSIQRTVTSGLQNWILVHYVLRYPPAFFLHGKRVELLSKATTGMVAEQFFAGLMEAAQAHFSSSESIDVAGSNVNIQQQKVTEPALEHISSDHARLPQITMNLPMKECDTWLSPDPRISNSSSAAGPSQCDGHVGITLKTFEDDLGADQDRDIASEKPDPAFKIEETHQRMYRDEEIGALPANVKTGSNTSSYESTPLSSIASNGIEALLCHSMLWQCPSEGMEQFMLSHPSERRSLSRCSSLLNSSVEKPMETVSINLKKEPQPQAEGPTSSLFATSLPHPPWLDAPRAPGTFTENTFGQQQWPQEARVPPYWVTSSSPGANLREVVFGKELVEVYLKPDEVEEFMHHVDMGGYGKINRKMFKRGFYSMYKLRKAFLRAVKNQVSICNTVTKMISLLLWVVAIVALLLLLGLNFNTVIVSGIATVSALTVALSNLYKEFIGAVIFIAISNPYNVGDRVRINDGIPMYVKRIRTYTTEFQDIYGKQVLHSNDALWKCTVINESRAKNASHNFVILVQIETQMTHLKMLEQRIKQAMDSQPMDYVKDSFLIFISNFKPGRWLEVSIFVTTVENWGNITKTLRLRTDIFLVIQSTCSKLGITYHEPHLPVQLDPRALVDLIQASQHESHPDNSGNSSSVEHTTQKLEPQGIVSSLRRRFDGSPGQRTNAQST